jgi:membrane-associated phospholipid phosphatase
MTDAAIPSRDQRAWSRPRLLTVGTVLVLLAVALGVWIYARGDTPFALDAWWNTVLAGWRWAPAEQLSLALNVLGGGLVAAIIPAVGIVVLAILRRPWSAAYLAGAEILSVLVVQLLKHTFGRARPEDIQVVSDHGSYPSGHVANATTLVVVLVVVLPRAWTAVVAALWVVLMAFSRTYLHAHWLSDTLGGALVGAGCALVVAGALAPVLARERMARLSP